MKRFAIALGLMVGFAWEAPAFAQSDNLGEAISRAVNAAVNRAIDANVQNTVTWATNLAVDTAIEATPNAAYAAGPDGDFGVAHALGFDDDANSCPDSYNVNFDDYKTYSASEQHTIPASVGSIWVHGVHNGGVSVRGWDKNEIQVIACKYVGADSDREGQSKLSAIHVNISGGDISATGPESDEHGRWVLHFLVHAPKNVAMKLEAYNGPMSIRDTGSEVEAETVNGPLSIKLASGTVKASTRNGPLSITDCSGNITASAQNGPLTVSLNDKQWRGQGLEASTHNGPVTVRVPEGYESGVDVEASGHSPFSCSLKDCDNVQSSKPWDRDKKVHIGSGNTVVRVSTVNGPVHIGSSME